MLRELFNRLIAEANATRHLTSEKSYHISDQPVDFVEHSHHHTIKCIWNTKKAAPIVPMHPWSS